MHLRSLAVLAAFVGLVSVIVAVPASGRTSQSPTSTYVVQLIQAPVAGYEGGIAGYRATRPGKGQKLDASSPDAKKYAGF